MKWALVLILMLPFAGAIADPAGDVSVEYLLTGDDALSSAETPPMAVGILLFALALLVRRRR